MKIGIASDPQKRLAALRTGTPFRLSLAHVEAIGEDLRAVSVERAAHAILSASRAHGEWFSVTAEEAIDAVRRATADLRTRVTGTSPPAALSGGATIDPVQCRVARALLDWTQQDLSDVVGLSKVTIRAFEKGGGMRDGNRALLRLAFERAGVQFIDMNGGGPGARLKEPI